MASIDKPVNIDCRKRFVRVTNLRDDGFIEFDFAIGEPEIYLEMILRATDFDRFCDENMVAFLTDTQQAEGGWDWSMRDARKSGGGSEFNNKYEQGIKNAD